MKMQGIKILKKHIKNLLTGCYDSKKRIKCLQKLICSHEEANIYVFVHTKDASTSNKRIAIRTVDIDILVIAIAMFPKLDLEELWCDFGTGKHRVPASTRKLCFSFMHFQVVIKFLSSHCKKKTAWKTWGLFDDATYVFHLLSSTPTKEDVDRSLPLLERYTSLLYSAKTNCLDINQCKKW